MASPTVNHPSVHSLKFHQHLPYPHYDGDMHSDGVKIPGIAKPKPLPPIEVRLGEPVTSGGLRREDMELMLDWAEVMARTSSKATAIANREATLISINAFRRLFHLRFDKKCDHRNCAGRDFLF